MQSKHAWAGLGAAILLQTTTPASEPLLLARLDGPPAAVVESLPVHACLLDAQGTEYVLVFAERGTLDRSGRSYSVLYTNALPSDFVLARTRRAGWREPILPGELIADDGHNLLILANDSERAALPGLGLEFKALPERPVAARPRDALGRALAQMTIAPVTYDERVAEMLQQVRTTNLHALASEWSGDAPAVSGGELRTVTTRYTSGYASLGHATQLALQHLQALGLAASLHHWSNGGYSNRNVVATLPGGALSNEIVLVTAHLDSTSPTPLLRAPGADDNASGSAAVLVAADLLRRFRFDRTVRFVLFTGEEQGLLGSKRYASLVSAAGENVVAVFNLDMIGWDSIDGPTLRLHTRTTGNPGYTADLELAETFTNVVATYGLGASLTPILDADGEWRSDHSPFWDLGYPSILAIEDDVSDFHAYYHTTNDTVARLNLPYFTAFTKAAIGTAAHLAQPAGRVPFDVIQVDSSDWTPGSGIGAGTFYARHEEGATEGGADARDEAWSSAPANPHGRWLRIHTEPYGAALATDARPIDSETIFRGQLTAITTGAAPFSCTNRLRFTHLSALESNRSYLVRVQVDGRYTAESNGFLCVTNLRQLVEGGGFISLPLLANLTNGAVYGTCDIGTHLQRQDPAFWPLFVSSGTGDRPSLSVPLQVGFPVVDVVETSTNLLDAAGWQVAQVATSEAPVTASNFESGWDHADRSSAPAQTHAPEASFRLLRRWLNP